MREPTITRAMVRMASNEGHSKNDQLTFLQTGGRHAGIERVIELRHNSQRECNIEVPLARKG
jgi:hypothetical protein